MGRPSLTDGGLDYRTFRRSNYRLALMIGPGSREISFHAALHLRHVRVSVRLCHADFHDEHSGHFIWSE
jgi:hypothetical protein